MFFETSYQVLAIIIVTKHANNTLKQLNYQKIIVPKLIVYTAKIRSEFHSKPLSFDAHINCGERNSEIVEFLSATIVEFAISVM